MGEEESELLQVAQITVLGLYTLSPSPHIWSGASGDWLSYSWASRPVPSILTVLWDLMPLNHRES